MGIQRENPSHIVLPSVVERDMTVTAISAPTVVIRPAVGADGRALRRLAGLDSARVPAGELLVAESDGALVAAHAPGRAPRSPTRSGTPPSRRAVAAARLAPASRVTTTSPSFPSSTPAGAAKLAAPGWQVWAALSVVYVVWGSTYLAIRVMVETVPPLLGAGVRFGVAGAVMLAVLAFTRRIRPTRAQLLSALLIGLLLPGANAVITVAEQEVPSSVAALLVASIPLWVILIRRAAGETVSRASIGAVLVGFAGVALLVRPGEQSGEATLLGLAACVFGAVMWASGSFASPRIKLPADPLVSTGWQMLLGGLVISLVGLAAGEAPDVQLETFSTRSLVALAYLIVFGSWFAFTTYAWLLQNAPISRVATYAYVNPVVAIILGMLILDEIVTPVMIVGAAIIVVSVALVIRIENARRP